MLEEKRTTLSGSSSWNISVLQLYLMVHVLCFRNAAKWHFIPTSELYADENVNFRALLAKKCLQVLIQLDQAVTKAWLGAKSTAGADVVHAQSQGFTKWLWQEWR